MSDEAKFRKEITRLCEGNKKLKQQLKDANEVIDFYAEPNHSYVNGLTTYTKYKNDSDRHEDCGYSLVIIGKRAREYKDKYKGEG